mgnify:CR=1 FL=1
MLRLPSQHHLCILQELVVEQPVQFCPLCRGVAVLVLNGASPLDKEKHKALYYNKAIRT